MEAATAAAAFAASRRMLEQRLGQSGVHRGRAQQSAKATGAAAAAEAKAGCPTRRTMLWHWELAPVGAPVASVWHAPDTRCPQLALRPEEVAQLRQLFERGAPISQAALYSAGLSNVRLRHFTMTDFSATASAPEQRELDAGLNEALGRSSGTGAIGASHTVPQPATLRHVSLGHLRDIASGACPCDADINRQGLEQHLDAADFERAFSMGATQFAELPRWKQQLLKKAARLF